MKDQPQDNQSKSNNGLDETSAFVIISIVAFAFFHVGKAYQKEKHHDEIREMKKTVRKLSTKFNNITNN